MQAMEAVNHRARHLLVRSSVEASQLLVAVRDSAICIESAYMHHLFTPFFSIRDGGMGVSMGLSICHSIIESQGGRIWASSNDGLGASLQFTLPIRPENVA